MQSNFQLPSGGSLFWHILWSGLKDGVNPGAGLVMCLLVTLLLMIILLGKRFVAWAWCFLIIFIVVVFCVNFVSIEFILDKFLVLNQVLFVTRYAVAIVSLLLGIIFLRDWYLFKRYGSDQKNIFKRSSLHWTLNKRKFSWLLFLPISGVVLSTAVLSGLLQATWPMDHMMLKIFIKVLSGEFVGFPYVVGVYALSLGLPLVGIILGLRWFSLVESKEKFLKRYSWFLIVLAGFYVSNTILYFCIF